jgi:ribosomal protein L37E
MSNGLCPGCGIKIQDKDMASRLLDQANPKEASSEITVQVNQNALAMTLCDACGRRVIPKSNGACPECAFVLQVEGAVSHAKSTGSESKEQINQNVKVTSMCDGCRRKVIPKSNGACPECGFVIHDETTASQLNATVPPAPVALSHSALSILSGISGCTSIFLMAISVIGRLIFGSNMIGLTAYGLRLYQAGFSYNFANALDFGNMSTVMAVALLLGHMAIGLALICFFKKNKKDFASFGFLFGLCAIAPFYLFPLLPLHR